MSFLQNIDEMRFTSAKQELKELKDRFTIYTKNGKTITLFDYSFADFLSLLADKNWLDLKLIYPDKKKSAPYLSFSFRDLNLKNIDCEIEKNIKLNLNANYVDDLILKKHKNFDEFEQQFKQIMQDLKNELINSDDIPLNAHKLISKNLKQMEKDYKFYSKLISKFSKEFNKTAKKEDIKNLYR